jgi:hypothetical protein
MKKTTIFPGILFPGNNGIEQTGSVEVKSQGMPVADLFDISDLFQIITAATAAVAGIFQSNHPADGFVHIVGLDGLFYHPGVNSTPVTVQKPY